MVKKNGSFMGISMRDIGIMNLVDAVLMCLGEP